MKRALILLALIGLSPLVFAQAQNAPTLEYFGQECFLLTTSTGVRIVMDPHNLKYPLPTQDADVVTVSHEHRDHNNVEAIKGKPVVLRGLRRDGGFNNINETVKGVHIYNIGAYHDSKEGALFGQDSIFVFEFDKIRLIHLGDLGHLFDEKMIKKIGRPDFLLIPVGGHFTIDANQAWQVVHQLSPRVIIPMHYQTEKTKDIPIQPLDRFIKGRKDFRQLTGNKADLIVPAKQEIWVFKIPK